MSHALEKNGLNAFAKNVKSCQPAQPDTGRNIPLAAIRTPRAMGAIISLACNWWSNMHKIDA